MKIQLSDHFTYSRLFRFTLPSIIMMLVTSIYSTVDGLFVSNVVGQQALAAVNIIYPLTMVVGAFGFMLGTGGSAEVARAMGEGEDQKAREYFTTLILAIVALGALLSVLCILFIRPMAALLGADEALMGDCITYGVIMIAGSTFFMLQTSFQSFLICAERPKLGMVLAIASGLVNALLDYLFIVRLQWGVAGAALATVAGYVVGGVIPLVYFILPNSSPLRLVRTHLHPRMLARSSLNGSSELMSNISASLITVLYNRALMALAGSRGVAAYTAIMYTQFVFSALFIGFSIGVAPIFSYHYGAGNRSELKSLFRRCMTVVGTSSAIMLILAQVLARPMASVFVGYDGELLSLTVRGMRIFSLSYLFMVVSGFSSGLFTALGDGPVSAAISFLRTLLFQVGAILLLPLLLGVDGIWWATPLAEMLAFLVSLYFLISRRKTYHYA